MRIQRVKNASRNIVFGMLLKVYQIIMPFIMRTVMIYYLGIEYAGLNNLFISILQVLNLAELGIGAAMIYSMYEPIAKNDEKKICALMNLYKISFRVIGLIVLVLGLVILPFVPKFISGSVPNELNIYILYLMHLAVTVISYWLFSYKNSLLYAHQRTDISSKVVLGTNTFQYIFQLISLLVFKNYYLYLIVSIITQIATNIITSMVVDKIYPSYKASGKVDEITSKSIKKHVLGLITNKIGSTVLNSTDAIIISSFLGLSILAIYQNYQFIITAVISIVTIVYQACLAGIGNSLILEDKKKNYDDFRTMNFIIYWISSFCSSCMICLFKPFMKIWMGDTYLLDIDVVICLVVYFFIYQIEQLIGMYKDAAGIWYEDRFRPLITAAGNVILSLILVNMLGLYGVKIATIICMVILSLPWLIANIFKYIFPDESKHKYCFSLGIYVLLAIINCCLTYFICSFIPDTGIINLIIKMIVCVIISNIINLIIFIKNKEFKRTFNIIKKFLIRKNINN